MSLPEAVALAAWCFAVALAGGLVGLVLGNIRLPAVLLVAASPASAGGANIAISGVAAATASVAHVRAGRINWRLLAWMAPPSVLGAASTSSAESRSRAKSITTSTCVRPCSWAR